MSEWYCRIADQEFGPIPSAELKQLAATGELSPHDMVRRHDMQQWVTARHVQDLFSANLIGHSAEVDASHPNSQSAHPMVALHSGPPPLHNELHLPQSETSQDTDRSGLLSVLAIVLMIVAGAGVGLGTLGYVITRTIHPKGVKPVVSDRTTPKPVDRTADHRSVNQEPVPAASSPPATTTRQIDWTDVAVAGLKELIKAKIAENQRGQTPAPQPSTARIDNSADGWAANYLNARYISTSDFLANVHSAQLVVNPSDNIVRQLGRAEVEKIAKKIARRYGIEIDPQAPIAFVVNPIFVYPTISRQVSTGYDTYDTDFQVYSLFVDAGFAVAAPCLRNGQFVPLWVYPVRSFRVNSDWHHRVSQPWLQRADRRDAKQVIADNLEYLLEDILKGFSKNIRSETSNSARSWQNARWSSDQNLAAYQAYQAAARAEIESRVFRGIGSISTPEISLEKEAYYNMVTGRPLGEWKSALRQAGFQVGDSSPIEISHDIFTLQSNIQEQPGEIGFYSGKERHFDTNLSSITVWQCDVAFEFNGVYRRRPVVIYYRPAIEISTLRKLTDTKSVLDRLVIQGIDDFGREAANER